MNKNKIFLNNKIQMLSQNIKILLYKLKNNQIKYEYRFFFHFIVFIFFKNKNLIYYLKLSNSSFLVDIIF